MSLKWVAGSLLLAATVCSVFGQQEFAFPMTAKLQSRIPPDGIAADSYYLPGSSDVSCFEGTAAGNRYLCLSDSGTVLQWTADNRIRKVADGFVGPLSARSAPDGTLYVLDRGRGTLTMITPAGVATQIMGSGSERVIAGPLTPKGFDLPYFVLSRDFYVNSMQLGMDPNGTLYLTILREENTVENNQNFTKRFFYVLRLENKGTTLTLHWNGSSNLASLPNLPQVNAVTVDKDRNMFFALDGQLSRLAANGAYTQFTFTLLNSNSNPVKNIVALPDGNIILHSTNGNVMRLFFAELRTDLDIFANINGAIGLQNTDLIGLDLNQNRLLRFTPSASAKVVYTSAEVARLLRYVPLTGSSNFRAAFDNPIGVTIDLFGQMYVVENGDGAVYKISSNGIVDRIARPSAAPAGLPSSTATFAMDAFPQPLTSVATDSDGRLYLLDGKCNVFVQVSPTAARFLSTIGGACQQATMVFDLNKTLHISGLGGTGIFSGSGDPINGNWTFARTYTGSNIRSISVMVSGDLLVLEGPPDRWTLRRVNTNTGRAVLLKSDESLNANVNVRLSSAVTDFSGRISAVSCCSSGSSNESGRRYILTLQVNGNDVLSAVPRSISLYDAGEREAPVAVFPHRRGIVLSTTLNRLYYFEDASFRAGASVSLPSRQTWTYNPDGGLQEIAIPAFPGFGPTAFRTKMACDNNFDAFVRIGPAAAVAPTQLRLGLDTVNAPPINATCAVELLSVDTGKSLAKMTVLLVPDPVRLAAIPPFTILQQLTPFSVDPAATTTRTLRILNNSGKNRDISLTGTLPDGITITPAVLSLKPRQSGEFTITINPQPLVKQNYQIPLQATCPDCDKPAALDLSFQINGRTTSIDISAEAVLVELASLNARNNASRLPATSLVLSALDETDISIRTDFGAGPKWFSIQKSASSRTADGKLVISYDVVLDRAALPTRQTSNIVAFEAGTLKGIARRFLTVFYYPPGTPAQRLFESGASGSSVNLTTARSATVTIPVYSRATTPTVFTTYTIGGGAESISVASTQGVVGTGPNEIQLDVQRTGASASASESKDIAVLFNNGEKLVYSLNVLTLAQQAIAQSKPHGNTREAAGTCAGGRLLLTPRAPSLPFTVVRNIGARFQVELKDECNQLLNAADNVQLRYSVEPANGNITVTSVGGGLWEIFWNPAQAAASVNAKVIAVRSPNNREIYTGTLPVTGVVTDSAVPSLRSFSVVDGASFVEKRITAPGAYVSIFGDNLASRALLGNDNPAELPLQLDGLSVEFNGKPAPLLFVSPTQINLQVPFDLESNEYRLVVRRGDLVSVPSALGVGSASPGIFTLNSTGSGQGVIYKVAADGSNIIADTSNPAVAGDTIIVFAGGLGPTDPLFTEGKAVPDDGPLSVISTLQLSIGGQQATDTRASLAPGLIGIYRVTASLPASVVPADAVPVVLRANGVESQTVTMAVGVPPPPPAPTDPGQ